MAARRAARKRSPGRQATRVRAPAIAVNFRARHGEASACGLITAPLNSPATLLPVTRAPATRDEVRAVQWRLDVLEGDFRIGRRDENHLPGRQVSTGPLELHLGWRVLGSRVGGSLVSSAARSSARTLTPRRVGLESS